MKDLRLSYHEVRGWEIAVERLLDAQQLATVCAYARTRRLQGIKQMPPGTRRDRDLEALRNLRPENVHQVLPANKEVVLL